MVIFTLCENQISMFRTGFIFLIFFCLYHPVKAQDTLPDISVKLLGKKALVSWVNPYDNVTSISIQRSGDSIRNFKSIGEVLNAGAKGNGFVDQKEFLPNEEYYRLFITFEGGEYLFTKASQPVLDTTSAIVAVPEVKEVIIPKPKEEKKEEKKEAKAKPAPVYFSPSLYVFTGKDQNVTISLPDAKYKKYSIKFFEDDHTFLFEIKHIPESLLIIEKTNFIHSGLFRFELYESGKLREAHKVYIPKPGKPMPLLDVNGYEIRKQ